MFSRSTSISRRKVTIWFRERASPLDHSYFDNRSIINRDGICRSFINNLITALCI